MVAVDSSVIIHLARIGKLRLLSLYFKKIKITQDIEQEIIKDGKVGYEEIKKGIGKWIEIKKVGQFTEKTGILSSADIELIKMAESEKDFILTNDENIILFAKAREIETMWLTTFLILCVKKKLIDKKEAKQILHDLVKCGCYIRTDTYASVQDIIDEI